MPDNFLKSVSGMGFVLAAVLAGAASLHGRWIWASGILVGMCWVFLNVFFLSRLLEMGFGRQSYNKKKVLLFSILKFPVIYLAGFYILKSRFFPVDSILIGLSLFFVSLALLWVRLNLGNREAGKSLS